MTSAPTIIFQAPNITIAFDPVAHTCAPYMNVDRPDGTNHGFVDLRDQPDIIDSIPEVQDYPCLRNLLLALNRPRSRFMSLGCDRGPIRDSGNASWPFGVAAYATVAFRDLSANRVKDEHINLAHSLWAKLEPLPKQCPVTFELCIEPLKWLWDITDAFALDLKMIAYGRTEDEALQIINWLVPEVAKAIEQLAAETYP